MSRCAARVAFPCRATIPQSQLACKRHWMMLPKDLRTTIGSSYRAGDVDAYRPALLEALRFWKAAA